MRNATAYDNITDAQNIETRVNARRDNAPLGMREVASLFERLMFRPGKWVSLAAQAAGATRWGQGSRRVFGGVHCYDDAVVLANRLQALCDQTPGCKFKIELRQRKGIGTIEVRVNFN